MCYLESQVAHHNRLLYPKVTHYSDQATPNYGLLAFHVGISVHVDLKDNQLGAMRVNLIGMDSRLFL